MKYRLYLSIGILVALSINAYADPPAVSTTTPGAKEISCRKLIVLGEEKGVYCGNTDQWEEFDRRAALINDGLICRRISPGLPRQACMKPEQWKAYDRRVRNYHDSLRMGWIMSR